MRGDNVKLHRLQVTIDLNKSKLYVKTKLKFSKDINSFASKGDKRKIVEINSEWKLYKENKEISTLTLNYCYCFWPLVHGQWKDLNDRANSRTTTEECLHWRRSSVSSCLLHLI